MGLDINEIVINKRSGVIHTKTCEAVKQMKEENKEISNVGSVSDIQKAQPCGHCIKKRDLKQLYKEEYTRRKALIEHRRRRDHIAIDEKYDDRLEKLELSYRENMRGLDD